MSSRVALGLVALWVAVALPHAEESLITIQSTITASELRGGMVSGTMQLAMVNATDAVMRNVKLRLANPGLGSLGTGSVDLGTIDLDATVAPVVEFELQKSFLDSNEPLVITATYQDSADRDHEANIIARRTTEGGGL